jgi:hypothetical protein
MGVRPAILLDECKTNVELLSVAMRFCKNSQETTALKPRPLGLACLQLDHRDPTRREVEGHTFGTALLLHRESSIRSPFARV